MNRIILLVFYAGRFYISDVMRSTFLLSVLILIVALAVTTAFAVVIKDRPTAYSNGSDITLRWTTDEETGVQRFEIVRAVWELTQWGPFVLVGSVDQLKGNNSSYEYVDKSVFKSSAGVYGYRIRVINGSNPAPETEPVSVSHLSSAAKRTWGSIKAMFR